MNTLSSAAPAHGCDETGRAASGADRRSRGVQVVVGATVATALGFGCLALTSVFIRPLEAEFGWSRAEISLGYAAGTVGMALGGLVWGRATDRLDIRLMLAIGGAGMVLSMLGMTLVGSLWHLYAANLALGGLGFAALYAPLLSATSEWFERHRGMAVGIVTAGGALGQGVLPFLANMMIDGVGWRLAFLSLAAGNLVALGLLLPRVTRPQSSRPPASSLSPPETGLSAREKLSVATLSLAAFLCCVCMGVPLVHLASFVAMVCGSPSAGATSLLVAMLFGTAGRIFFGGIADRIGYVASYALASAVQTACVAAYPIVADSTSLMVLSAIFGFGFAGNMTCLILCVREAVPAHRFGGALGVALLVAWIGMGAGGYAGGALFDAYRSYSLAFGLAALAGLLNLLTLGGLAVMIRMHGASRRA
jgi:MFS family permease